MLFVAGNEGGDNMHGHASDACLKEQRCGDASRRTLAPERIANGRAQVTFKISADKEPL
jgi:hypothetical protein